MRMTSERRTDNSAIRKERAHLSCQLKASFVVNDHYRDFSPRLGPRAEPSMEPDFNDSSSCPNPVLSSQ
jgi:hypothetical protein